MATLKPLGGVAKRPPSALAAFAKTLNEPVDDPVRPQPLVLGGLKPLASLGASGDVSVKSNDQLRGLSPVKKPGEISALAAFASTAVIDLKGDGESVSGGPGALAAKRPLPLPLKSLGKADSKEKIQPKRPTIGGDHSNSVGNEEAPEQLKEVKVNETENDMKTVEVVNESEAKELQVNGSTADARSGSSDDDSMAEFACMESDDEEDNEAKSSGSRDEADVDDLYDHDDEEEVDDKTQPQLRTSERMFVPRMPNEPLFHAIVAEDLGLLSHILSHMTPSDILETRDTDGRTMYHYAAMSRNSKVQAVVFEFINCFFALEIESKVAEIEKKQRRLDSWRSAKREADTTWVAPSVKDLKESSDSTIAHAYLQALQAQDHHKRSCVHYSAISQHTSPFHTSQRLRKAVKRNPRVILAKDQFDRSALDYAVLADNTTAIELWLTQLGVAKALAREDVDRLAQLVRSKTTQSLLCRLFEDADRVGFAFKQNNAPKHQPALGLSVQFLAKTQHNVSGGLGQPAICGSARLRSSLHNAVIFGNVEAVEALIEQGADVNACDIDGWTALHHCAAQGTTDHIVIAERLLEHRANINARSQHGRTPLHRVAMRNPSDDEHGVTLATLLCAHGAKLELNDDDQSTPFLSAVATGNTSVARFLLEQGCNGAAVGKTGGCALHIAAARGLEEMVRFLSRWDAELVQWRYAKDHQGRVPRALAKCHSILLAMDNLWSAVRSGDPEAVRVQLHAQRQCGKDKRERGKYLSVHDTTSLSSRTALHLVIEGYTSETRCRSPRKPKQRETQAVQTILLLLQAGASLSAQDKWGITPLMLAACVDTPVLIQHMIKAATQEDLTQPDADGNTALHYSYAFARAQISSILEDAMDEADIENNLGKRPLAVTGYRQKLYPKAYADFLKKHNQLQRS